MICIGRESMICMAQRGFQNDKSPQMQPSAYSATAAA